MSKPRILFSVPTRHHVEIALDELEGLQDLGYSCNQFPYAAKSGVNSKLGRFKVILENAWTLVKTARSFKPDVIYLNSRLEVIAGIRDFITIAMCKAFYKGRVKFVIKSHGSDLEVLNSNKSVFGKVILPYLMRNISGWLFLSTEEKNIAEQTGFFKPNTVFVTKNIVRNGHFKTNPQFRKLLNIPDDHKVLLFVGRLINEKGIFEVIDAFASIKDDYKVTLIVVGWGPELEKLKAIAKDKGITNRILFTGFIPEKDVVEYYSNCDILVFPTFFPEGFPMALFNSVTAGMAVVTTRTRAATDYLSAPQNCLWVQPRNAESVKAGLTQLLQSEELMLSIKNNNLVKGTEFSKKHVSAELAVIIEQITVQ